MHSICLMKCVNKDLCTSSLVVLVNVFMSLPILAYDTIANKECVSLLRLLHKVRFVLQAGVWPCPFRGFHCCPDGMAGSKGFPRLVAHIKRLHLSSDDRRGALREALSTDCELFVSVGEALKALDQWVAGDAEEFIVGIVRPQVRREVVPLGGVVVDEVLLDRVFSLPITTVKSIPHSLASRRILMLMLLLCIQRALASWGGDGFIELIPSLFAQPLRVVSGKDDRVSGVAPLRYGYFDSDVWLSTLYCRPSVMPGGSLPRSLLCLDDDNVLGCIQSFPKGQLLRRECPKVMAEFVASAPLTEGDVQITLGLSFGVVVPKRGRGRAPWCNRFLNKFHLYGSLAMLTVDFSNAFNLVDQTTLLNNVQTRCPSISLWVDFLYGQSASFDYPPSAQKAVVECLRAPRAQNFLAVIPIKGLGQHMSALEYRTILKYRLMIPLFPVDEPTQFARKCLLEFLWGKNACMDLTGVSPLVGLMDNRFVAGQAALKAKSSKVA
ncbi:hypothetical protein Tco_0682736 [Tanacetum coccineum]|uniref:Reverse transcriptase domain-containing protein n=1 Tax=Tanacetum coccineum TaxID=301880 RepID=A0ABQ4XSL3_9ASTR